MIILDTHIWLYWVNGKHGSLNANLIKLIEDADDIAVSAISCWEVAWLVRRKRVLLSTALEEWYVKALSLSDIKCISINQEIASCSANLPEHHRDPADRLIISTAIVKNAQLISFDSLFPAYTELHGKLIQK